MADDAINPSPKSRAAQCRLSDATPARLQHSRSSPIVVATVWPVATPVLSLCSTGTHHATASTGQGSLGRDHAQDSTKRGSSVTCPFTRKGYDDWRNRDARGFTISFIRTRTWLIRARNPVLKFNSIMNLTDCFRPSLSKRIGF